MVSGGGRENGGCPGVAGWAPRAKGSGGIGMDKKITVGFRAWGPLVLSGVADAPKYPHTFPHIFLAASSLALRTNLLGFLRAAYIRKAKSFSFGAVLQSGKRVHMDVYSYIIEPTIIRDSP